MWNGVGPQVLTTLGPALPLQLFKHHNTNINKVIYINILTHEREREKERDSVREKEKVIIYIIQGTYVCIKYKFASY